MDIERIDWWGKEKLEEHKKIIQDHLEKLIKETNGNTIHPK